MTHIAETPQKTGTGGAFGFVRNGYDRAEPHDLTTTDVENATIYGRNDETIGTISSLEITSDGKISDAVIEVGGFLGLGAHSVLLPFEQLTVLRETDGSDLRVHLDTTKEKLKAMPQHTG
ncbi:PRC-barrel domain-containing protein [Lutimaribacter sp. EGI FJ00015]|uniref:PRC-barrel domain-containing protein n=1 Tax=Lutimaribacter degradans TaxID=2945989 RepID=A0ACC5ZZI4_9RHOB|nr:PRC-barrel domain-containing protein [Lutimaribacter sp. EGI FJ00013]MCM2563752.1 PRC-barrel domain-containing protein [Lutimaribacter sp. EGI FJ00013]MCO0614937.1 PRC-barrel domain-containing protein [Lutimaribacter sp. EGI FJ00015]MCO0637582.1 PRC-barrel domain-containing protein [Lutimaribacter sp. EGI FJ00014]